MLSFDAPAGLTVYVAPALVTTIVATNTAGFVELKMSGGSAVIVKGEADDVAAQINAALPKKIEFMRCEP